MADGAPRLAFIGLGEAAAAMAAGLRDEGLSPIRAFDTLLDDPDRRAGVEARAADCGVTLAADLGDLIDGAGIVVAAVTSAVALPVAEAAARHLQAGQIYMDINSVAPDTKRRIGAVIEASGARFVEASVMAAVPPKRHKVPILLCGAAAPEVIEALRPYGMTLTDFGREWGRAAATKMFRSIIVKGLEALLLECVVAADKYGVAEQVLKSVEDGYPGVDWNGLAHYFAGRTAIHGERRAHEMEEVAATLSEMGIDPIMAAAAAKRIHWGGSQGLKDHFGGVAPETYDEVLTALKERAGGGAP